jgi:hypothetical protein
MTTRTIKISYMSTGEDEATSRPGEYVEVRQHCEYLILRYLLDRSDEIQEL